MAIRRAYTQPMAGLYSSARIRKVLGVASLPLATTDLNVAAAGNSIAAFVVPAGFTVTGINATLPDLDSGTSLTLSIGDSTSTTRLVNASTTGQAGGTINTVAATGQYYTFPVDTEILLTTTAGTAGATAGTVTNFYIEGFVALP